MNSFDVLGPLSQGKGNDGWESLLSIYRDFFKKLHMKKWLFSTW